MILSSELIDRRNAIIQEHRKVIDEIRGIEKKVERLLAASDSRWQERHKDRNPLLREIDRLINAYWGWIPAVSLSRCPICNAELFRTFDPVDLTGFWWMDRAQRPGDEPEPCSHFNLLTGALNLNGLPPKGGPFESRPGPDVPYIIPRILEMPTMQVVISSISMHCGYTAYPVAYYSQEPAAGGTLTQTWAQPQYYFTTADGKTGWNIVDDSYDFDLLPWLRTGKIRWLEEGKLNPKGAKPEECPFQGIKGMRKPQIIVDDELGYEYRP